MQNKWNDEEAKSFVARYGDGWGEELALRTYSARLLGGEPSLVLHGGGNTSVKVLQPDTFGNQQEVIFVKASGYDLANIEPEGHAALELSYLKRLEVFDAMTDEEMTRHVRGRLLDYRAPNPSIEALVHAFIPGRYIDHTHADAVLALTNQANGRELVERVLGDDIIVIDYVKPGFGLAKAMAEAVKQKPECRAAVWMLHGIVTWGETARESYDRMIELVSRAESFLKKAATHPLQVTVPTQVETAQSRWRRLAPILRGVLSERTEDSDRPVTPVILAPLVDRATLDFVDSDRGKQLALTPPLTSDHLIRTKPYPLWVDGLDWEQPETFRSCLEGAVEQYRREYSEYVERYAAQREEGLARFETAPRVLLIPGLGAVCAGRNVEEAAICRDITSQTLQVKAAVAAVGEYRGMSEADLCAMEYRGLQHAKLRSSEKCLERRVAIVTGAAGAIGSGVTRVLLEQGCHVALTDLPGDHLDSLTRDFEAEFGGRVLGVPIDVTDPASITAGFEAVSERWGGVDLVIVNAGLAMVSSLAEMDLEKFRRLEKVNIEGTLLMLSESARHLELQGIGGDIVLISTKNVFAPGAKFGAYSATKAGAHQLARIASLELAGIDVRVNMVSPDAVFEDGSRKSGLWATVGPDRMKARGLDERQLQEYYRSRNLLKSGVTARHVGNAVLYFATRQTPTTGATIPVDGGLPDATPR
ncbi:MAG: bifunctional aldolase/short-chain dehydrogenase [Acidobacteriota bacterium]|nr:MAG: bifunctional aldolase/short-chain dehydrogenase [Acidobacteriota bacterium]